MPRPQGHTASTPAELIAALRNGERDAWTEAHRRHDGEMYQLARRLLICRADARDIVQEAWIVLVQKVSREPADANQLRAYLLGLVRFKCMNANRLLLRRNTWTDQDQVTALMCPAPDPEGMALLGDWLGEVGRAVANMARRRDRDVLTAELGGPGAVGEVSDTYGLVGHGFSRVLSRARQRLRCALDH